MAESESRPASKIVPDSVIPHGALPPLEYRDLPDAVPIRKMVGPGVILAGLALGSGEFVIWPKITYESGFIFFWACLLGVTIQYFLNLEITRWTLATGESAVTGFCRLSRHWAIVFLFLNIIPWILPGWATGAAHIVGWLIWGEQFDPASWTMSGLAIGGLVLCGVILTAGPVIYETVEKIQFVLVSMIMLLVIVLAILVVRPDAVAAQVSGAFSFGVPEVGGDTGLNVAMLLGALAFAGAGGALNLGQSNYVKDKGYGMGKYIGRITSPITGYEEAMSEVGLHFHDTPENLKRWRQWWRAACIEHFFSFFLTCLICLVLLTLISYSIFYGQDGIRRAEAEQYGEGMQFIWGEAEEIGRREVLGQQTRLIFLVMGVAILLTTEFGVLDVISRVSTDLVKVNWLRENAKWTESRLYFVFLWGLIAAGAGIILLQQVGINVGALQLFVLSSAMNGGVMFLYSILLLVLNLRALPRSISASWWRMIILSWSVAFFGVFTFWVAKVKLAEMIASFR